MRDRSRRFEGKTVLITGAARGQGRAHAVRFRRGGANVIGTDICEQIDVCPCPMGTAEDLQETVRLVEDLDQRMVAIKADVRDGAAMKEAVDRGLEEFGKIDVWWPTQASTATWLPRTSCPRRASATSWMSCSSASGTAFATSFRR